VGDERDWYIKFDPEDWNGDTQLRRCSLSARGLWAAFLEPMHKAIPYGHLLVNGVQPSYADLAFLASCKEREVKYGIEELVKNGVASVREDGVLFSRRMVRDGERRDRNRKNGRQGGNPKLQPSRLSDPLSESVRKSVNTSVHIYSSNSSSGSNSPVVEKKDGATDERWIAFLEAYPSHRVDGSYMALQGFIFACGQIGFTELMIRLELQKQSEDWKKGMVPRTGNYFERQLWRQKPAAPVDPKAELLEKARALYERDQARWGSK